jgi:hypothetical protein
LTELKIGAEIGAVKRMRDFSKLTATLVGARDQKKNRKIHQTIIVDV